MLTLLELFYLYLKHYRVNRLFAETSSHLFKIGHFKNVHFSKPNYYFLYETNVSIHVLSFLLINVI
jgi:hypothetical protein